jgi:hypothetical protein
MHTIASLIAHEKSEFEKRTPEEVRALAVGLLGHNGMMISGSKSGYKPKQNIAVFNANVCTKELGKIWYGDIDITISSRQLEELAKALKQSVYVLSESHARFENETAPLFDYAVWWTDGVTSQVRYTDSYKLNRKKQWVST